MIQWIFWKAAVCFVFFSFLLCDTHWTYTVAPQRSNCESVRATPATCRRQCARSGVTSVSVWRGAWASWNGAHTSFLTFFFFFLISRHKIGLLFKTRHLTSGLLMPLLLSFFPLFSSHPTSSWAGKGLAKRPSAARLVLTVSAHTAEPSHFILSRCFISSGAKE